MTRKHRSWQRRLFFPLTKWMDAPGCYRRNKGAAEERQDLRWGIARGETGSALSSHHLSVHEQTYSMVPSWAQTPACAHHNGVRLGIMLGFSAKGYLTRFLSIFTAPISFPDRNSYPSSPKDQLQSGQSGEVKVLQESEVAKLQLELIHDFITAHWGVLHFHCSCCSAYFIHFYLWSCSSE